MDRIGIKAGKNLFERIRDGGFRLDQVTAYFAPAGGPRWLVAGGFDLSLIGGNALGQKQPVLLAGASAGAWRFAAWIQPEAEKSYRAFRDAYIQTTYTPQDTPASILRSYDGLLHAFIEEDALPFALNHKCFRIAITTARARHLVSSHGRVLQGAGLVLAFAGNLLSRSLLRGFAERVVFYSGPKPPAFSLRRGFHGRYFPLNPSNFKHALMASGAIPLAVRGINDIYGAPRGTYRDGGLVDYHLSLDYAAAPGDAVLFFHHQERIVPGWLDKPLKRRRPPAAALENVLMVHPTEAFLRTLPRGRIPDRDDFKTFMNNPEARREIWRDVADKAACLGDDFLERVGGTRWKDDVQPL
jgi:hypothetical protein